MTLVSPTAMQSQFGTHTYGATIYVEGTTGATIERVGSRQAQFAVYGSANIAKFSRKFQVYEKKTFWKFI